MIPAIPALRFTLALVAAIALVGAPGCNDNPSGGPAPASSTPRALPAPAGADISALLDGLKSGDKLAGVPVAAIGAIDSRGAIPIVLQQGDSCSVIAIAARTEEPSPPMSTRSYSLFFEGFDHRSAVPQQQLLEAMRDLASRLKKTEDKLPVPAGLKALARPGAPA